MLISRETKTDIELSCPKCNQSLVVESKYMGQILPCPACATDILVPAGAVKNSPEKNLLKTKEQPPKIEDGDSPERHPILQQAGNRKKKKFLDGAWKIPVFILVAAVGVFVSEAIKKYYYEPMGIKTETLGGSATVSMHLEQAEAGDAAAQLQVAHYYEVGLGVKQNRTAAMRWYRKSASQGNPDAVRHVARLIMDDLGVADDEAWRTRFYKIMISAQEGDSEAQYLLGTFYSEGKGIRRDLSRAKAWLEKSALQGSAKSQALLEKLKTDGL